MSEPTTANIPTKLQFELVTDVLKLISYRLDDVETVMLGADSEFVDVEEIRAMLRTVRDDIFDQIAYKEGTAAKSDTPKLGDPDHDPEDDTAYAG